MTALSHSELSQQSDAHNADSAEKRGRRRKRRRQSSKADASAETVHVRREEDTQAVGAADAERGVGESPSDPSPESAPPRRRFIVFVGNLPYRVSASDVERLFSAMRPVGCRLPTDKDNRKPKGFAFVEFDDASNMRVTTAHTLPPPSLHGRTHTHCIATHTLTRLALVTDVPILFSLCPCSRSRSSAVLACPSGPCVVQRALQLHHSELGGRQINVELTAGGGGGKSELRKQRIKHKNEALTKERKAMRDKQSNRHHSDDAAQQAQQQQHSSEGTTKDEAAEGDSSTGQSHQHIAKVAADGEQEKDDDSGRRKSKRRRRKSNSGAASGEGDGETEV